MPKKLIKVRLLPLVEGHTQRNERRIHGRTACIKNAKTNYLNVVLTCHEKNFKKRCQSSYLPFWCRLVGRAVLPEVPSAYLCRIRWLPGTSLKPALTHSSSAREKRFYVLNDLKGNLTIKFESRKRTDITAVLVLVLIACFTNEFDETLMRHHASDINSVLSRYQFLSKFPAIVLM